MREQQFVAAKPVATTLDAAAYERQPPSAPYFLPTGCGSFFTGTDDNALSSESALFFAHERITGCSMDAFALALTSSWIERLNFARGFSVVVFMAIRVVEGTVFSKLGHTDNQRFSVDVFGTRIVQQHEHHSRVVAVEREQPED